MTEILVNGGGTVRDDIAALEPTLIALRRELHAKPEIGLHLPETQRIVLDALKGLDLEITAGTSTSSVTAVLRGASAGPAVLLRGDMDALPVEERTGLDFSSTHAGAMHACGHDLHTAMLVGAATVLSAHRDEVAGDVVFMFQPGEEGFDGASHMLQEGILDAAGRRVASAYGIHVMATMPRGVFATRPGTLMASCGELRVVVHGAGGHGSSPHHAKDPISVAAQMVNDLQTLVTRQFDVFDPVVVTVGSFHAGSASSIIPDDARFEATVRTFSNEVQDRIAEASVRLCRGIAAAYGLEVDATFVREYPATINDPQHAAFAASVVTDVFGPERYELMTSPQAGAEDFSRVLAEVPGCYLMLGASVHAGSEHVADNHSPQVVFDESVMVDGVRLHTELAMRALRRDASH